MADPVTPTLDLLTMRPTNSAPPEPVSPGTTVTDPMILKALNDPANKGIGQDKDEQENFLRKGFEFLRDSANAGVSKGWGALTGTAGLTPGQQQQSGDMAKDIIVPQTPAQAAGYAANLIPGAGWVPSLLRVGAAAGIGSAANAATGYDPIMGAAEAGGGQLIGEAGAGLLNRVTAARAKNRIGALDDAAIPKAIGTEVEAFAGAKTPADVKRLALGDGYEKLGSWFGKGQTQIVKALGDPEIRSGALEQFRAISNPGSASVGAGAPSPASQSIVQEITKRLGLKAGESPPGGWEMYIRAANQLSPENMARSVGQSTLAPTAGTMPLSEALDLVKKLGASAHQGDKTALGFGMRQLYRQAQEDITQAIGRVDPTMGTLYGRMRDQYSTGMTLLHAIKGDQRNIFSLEGNRVIFNRTPDANTGGTPLQHAISESLEGFKDYNKSPTVNSTFRGGEIGSGDARLRDFMNTLWIRQHGGSIVPGASVHTGVPGRPVFVGRDSIQPTMVGPRTGGMAGQGVGNAGSNLLDLNGPQ